jgi:glutathione synthase
MADPTVLFVVNDLDTLEPHQSTMGLLRATTALGASVWVCGADDVGRCPDGVHALGVAFDGQATVAELRAAPATALRLSDCAGVWVRTNPGRASHDHSGLLQLLHQAEAEGAVVRNRPSGLQRAASKLYLGALPEGTGPPTVASRRLTVVRDAVQRLGEAVVKPVVGTRGSGVQRLSADDPQLDDKLTRALEDGVLLVQAVAPGVLDGDVRVHVVGGRALEVDGVAAVVARRPGPDEWRSNVALGGRPERTELTPALRQLVESVGPTLQAHGLWHVGLDVVGPWIVECNVFSPGGLDDAGRFGDRDFLGALAQRFVASLDS